jgi:hypothetical protein
MLSAEHRPASQSIAKMQRRPDLLSCSRRAGRRRIIRAASAREEFLDFAGDLTGLNLNSLSIEVDVVAVVFGMASHG